MDNMDDQNSQNCGSSKDLFSPINKITQAINEKDLRLIENEALIMNTKMEIDKLERSTKELNESYRKLEAQTDSFRKMDEELNNSIGQSKKSLELKSDMLITLKQATDKLKIEASEQINQYKTIYNDYLEKYKKARLVYQTYHPLYKRLQQIRTANLKLEVEYKMLRQKIVEQRKRNRLRQDLHRRIFNASIVKFVKAVVDHWKARDLACQLKLAAKQEAELKQQLQQLELAAAKKEIEMRQNKTVTSAESSTFKLPSMEYLPPSSSATPYSFQPLPVYQPHEMLLQIRNRCEQRQQQWSKRRSYSSSLSNKRQISFGDKSPVDLKRPTLNNSPTRAPFKTSKINIINVQTIPGSEKPAPFNHRLPLKPADTKENLPMIPVNDNKGTSQHNVRPQSHSQAINKNVLQPLTHAANIALPGTLHYLSSASHERVYGSTQPREIRKSAPTPSSNVSQTTPSHYLSQSQEYRKNILTSNTKVAAQETCPQNYFTQNIFSPPQSQENNNTLSQSLNVSKTASQVALKLPLGYRSENIPSQSQYSVSQQIISQTQDNAAETNEVVVQSQSGVTQNLTHMLLSESQPGQNKTPDDSIATSQSSTFSQKCQQLSKILAKDTPEPKMACDVPSAPTENSELPEIITSPFFNKAIAGKVTNANDNNSMQIPAWSQKDLVFGAQTIDELLQNSVLFDGQEMEADSSFIDESRPILSPDYPIQEKTNENQSNEPKPSAAAFPFNFGQSTESKPFFSNMFNMFS